jgi:hypothetical protein
MSARSRLFFQVHDAPLHDADVEELSEGKVLVLTPESLTLIAVI